MRLSFIRPLSPSAAVRPRQGDDWLREPKLDGFRFQVAKCGRDVRLFSKYTRYAAELLLLIDRLPWDHPESEAARAKLRAMRPQALEAMDELWSLEIRTRLRLHDTPTDGMG